MDAPNHDPMHARPLRADALWAMSADAAVEVDAALVVVAANNAACRLIGCPERDVVGQSILDFIDVSERHAAQRQIQRSIDGEPCRGFPATFRFRDHPLAPVSLSMAALADGGLLIVGRDRTEEVESQQMLAEAGEALDNAEKLARFGLWVWDLTSDVVQWSEGVHQLTGIGPLEFDGTLDAHLAAIAPEDRTEVERQLRAARRSGVGLDFEHRLETPAGNRLVVECRAHPVRSAAGDVIALRGVLQDVTHAREIETLLRSAADHEHEAAEALRAADHAKDAFLATVSHELRTPITIFNGLLEILRDGRQDIDGAMRDDLLGRMHRSAVELRDMVERLLDFSRLQAGTVQLEIQPIDLAPILERVVGRLTPLFETRNVSIDCDDGLRVVGDVNALEHIVSNLVTNAVKYSDRGSVIEVVVAVDGMHADLTVSDHGRGIPAEFHDRLFERFYRVPGETGGARGTGVGLAVVKQYVDALGGTISVTSEPGVGSAFRVRLKRDPST